MSDELLTSVVEASTKALEGEGASLVFNIETFERELIKAGVSVKRLNRGALLAELEAVRAEIATQGTRAHHAATAEEHDALIRKVATLQRREWELIDAIWPDGERQ